MVVTPHPKDMHALAADASIQAICACSYLCKHFCFTVADNAFGHHAQEIITGKIGQAENLFRPHTKLPSDFLYRFALAQQALDEYIPSR